MSDLYVALLHYPVYDRNHNVVTTSVTNIDVHDIARSCRTYHAHAFFVVTPVDALRGLVRKILRHWQDGPGSSYNDNRRQAMELVRLERDLEGVLIEIERETGELPTLVATSARPMPRQTAWKQAARQLADDSRPWLLLLGTGWGMTDELVERCDLRLPPVNGPGDYNHLSVRAAAAVILDRLRGTG